MLSLKRDPQGMFDLGSDGVMRSFDGPYKHNVIDAIGLSPCDTLFYRLRP